MESFVAELRKIPPVTRFLCASSLVVTLPVLMKAVSAYHILFVKELVLQKFQVRPCIPMASMVPHLSHGQEAHCASSHRFGGFGVVSFWEVSSPARLEWWKVLITLKMGTQVEALTTYLNLRCCSALRRLLTPLADVCTKYTIVNYSRTTNELESGPYARRSADLAWQLIAAGLSIIVSPPSHSHQQRLITSNARL